MQIETAKPGVIHIHYDNVEFSSEPTHDEAMEISSRIRSKVFHIDCNSEGMPKFAYMVGRHGHAFCPVLSLYSPDKGFVFTEQQLFALEFNGKTTFNEVSNRARQLNLPMLLAYRRFLSTEAHERFCVCFLLDAPVCTEEGAWAIRIMLRTIFPESDVSDVDLNKVYLGGNYSIFCNKDTPTFTGKMLYDACCQLQGGGIPSPDYCRINDAIDDSTCFC